jgi:hypothetical protein
MGKGEAEKIIKQPDSLKDDQK